MRIPRPLFGCSSARIGTLLSFTTSVRVTTNASWILATAVRRPWPSARRPGGTCGEESPRRAQRVRPGFRKISMARHNSPRQAASSGFRGSSGGTSPASVKGFAGQRRGGVPVKLVARNRGSDACEGIRSLREPPFQGSDSGGLPGRTGGISSHSVPNRPACKTPQSGGDSSLV